MTTQDKITLKEHRTALGRQRLKGRIEGELKANQKIIEEIEKWFEDNKEDIISKQELLKTINSQETKDKTSRYSSSPDKTLGEKDVKHK